MLILASQSPRRAHLLRQINLPFEQIPVEIDESPLSGELPQPYVLRLAEQKAAQGWKQNGQHHKHTLVLGADTVVVADNHILGKPVDQQDSARMLRLLSGNEHQVLTAIAVTNGHTMQSILVPTVVKFCVLSQAQMDWYWQTGEPTDKAGSYAIQGLGGQFVTHIRGSYSAVVGLPLYETHQLLSKMGLTHEC